MNRRHMRSPFWQALWRPGAAVASPPLVFVATTAVLILQIPAQLMMRGGWISASILMNEILAVAGIPILLVYLLGFDRRRLLSFGRFDLPTFVALCLFMLGAVVLMDYATVLTERLWPLPPELKEAMDRVLKAGTAGMIAWKLILLCLIPAVCEEIFFRGFCQTSLAARWGGAWAIVAASIIFSMMHGNPHYFHLYFMLGVIFGWAYAVTGALWAAVFCHLFNNAWTFVNHVRGFEFPIAERWCAADTVLVAVSALVLIVSVRFIVVRSNAVRSRRN